MSFLSERKGTGGGWKAPSNDLYGIWGRGNNSMFSVVRKQVILPGVTEREEEMLETVPGYIESSTKKVCTVPMDLIEDVYSMYANEDIKRLETTSKNAVRQEILDKAYNSLTKDLTRGSKLFSMIVTKELSVWMQKVIDEIEEEQEKEDDKKEQTQSEAGDCDQAAGQGSGDESGSDPEGNGQDDESDDEKMTGKETGVDAGAGHGMTRAINSQDKALDAAMKKANKKMDELESRLGKEALKDLQNTEPDFLENIEEMLKLSRKSIIDKASMERTLKKILNKSENYFSKNSTIVEESLFDCEECEDLVGLEFLNPVFRNSGIMDIVNQTRKPIGKMDLFLDCSGSMDWNKLNIEGKQIPLIDVVKCIAVIMYRLGYIERLYFFDQFLYEIENINEWTILGFNNSGGTNFDVVIDKINENGRNSIVITDGEDRVSDYCEKAFFVGVGGTRFGDGFQPYKDARQCVTHIDKEFVYVTE